MRPCVSVSEHLLERGSSNMSTEPTTTQVTCHAFEGWWAERIAAISVEPHNEAELKRVAFEAWVAAATKCAILCELHRVGMFKPPATAVGIDVSKPGKKSRAATTVMRKAAPSTPAEFIRTVFLPETE